jgi:hypothetical protein
VTDGRSSVIVRRESLQQLLANDVGFSDAELPTS